MERRKIKIMNYEILLRCPYCQPDTAGNHAWNCPLNPINQNNIGNTYAKPVIYTTYTTDSTYNETDYILNKLKQSGNRLKELLGITDVDIDRAIKEFRRSYQYDINT